MIKVKDKKYIEEMGFTKNEDHDYICRGKAEDGTLVKLFTIYAGSLYIRNAKTAYTNSLQLKLIYDWTKKDYIEWEED